MLCQGRGRAAPAADPEPTGSLSFGPFRTNGGFNASDIHTVHAGIRSAKERYEIFFPGR